MSADHGDHFIERTKLLWLEEVEWDTFSHALVSGWAWMEVVA
jgi:hypothetical protein